MSPSAIARICATQFKVAPAAMLARTRGTKPVYVARMVAMVLCRRYTRLSTTRIGGHFARDHTTVLHAGRRIAERCARDPKLARKISVICALIDHDAAAAKPDFGAALVTDAKGCAVLARRTHRIWPVAVVDQGSIAA